MMLIVAATACLVGLEPVLFLVLVGWAIGIIPPLFATPETPFAPDT